jgi:hypothetical protein
MIAFQIFRVIPRVLKINNYLWLEFKFKQANDLFACHIKYIGKDEELTPGEKITTENTKGHKGNTKIY